MLFLYTASAAVTTLFAIADAERHYADAAAFDDMLIHMLLPYIHTLYYIIIYIIIAASLFSRRYAPSCR